MIFYNGSHKKFYNETLEKAKIKDCYSKSVIYILGIMEDTRNNISKIYDIEKNEIIHEAINEAFQTSGTINMTRLAFNLFNDTFYDVCNAKDNTPNAQKYTPIEIFRHYEYMDYIYEAIKIRLGKADETTQEIII